MMALWMKGGARLAGRSDIDPTTTTNFYVLLFEGTDVQAQEMANNASKSLGDNGYQVVHIDLFLRNSSATSKQMLQAKMGVSSWFIGISYKKPLKSPVSLSGSRQVKFFKGGDIESVTISVNKFANECSVQSASFRENDGVWYASVNYWS